MATYKPVCFYVVTLILLGAGIFIAFRPGQPAAGIR